MIAKNVLKSLVVIAIFIVLISLAILHCRYCVIKYHSGTLKKGTIVLTTLQVLITLLAIILGGDYVYPFERKIQPEPYAVLELPEDKISKNPGDRFWHGAYEKYGLYAESFYFDPDGENPKHGLSWPPMDFEHYSYIITYGQKISDLTYNVWDTINTPVRTGAKVGHMTLQDEFSPEKVYIYRIPKLRIENDINNTR